LIDLLLPALIDALCLVGLFAALSMTAKAARYARGELTEPSVVQQPRARAIGGIPNSVFGITYYCLLLVAAWWLRVPLVQDLALVASLAATAFSLYLAYSLLFVTRMPCVFCWTGHIVNWSLTALLIAQRALPS
jgi:uncharacterized membrane protein